MSEVVVYLKQLEREEILKEAKAQSLSVSSFCRNRILRGLSASSIEEASSKRAMEGYS